MLVSKRTNNKWTYNLMDHLMLYLEKTIALAFMTYIIDLNAYEVHPGDENLPTTLIMNDRVLLYIYDKGLLLLRYIFLYLC
jgi:hypothetical protein